MTSGGLSNSVAFVTGGAGFIGSHVVDRLLSAGHAVHAFDNLSTGQERFLEQAMASPRFTFVRGDLTNLAELTSAMVKAQPVIVFHLAANADVRFGTDYPGRNLEQNTIATFNVLEAMRAAGARRIAFSSTGSIYGEPAVFPTPEDAPFPVQTSLYGASKLAGEGLIQAYCEGFGFQGYIFRFVSILGERYSHGHVFDFYRSLRANPQELRVLGNGLQKKSYLYVHDCIDAIFTAIERATGKVHVFNLGAAEYCQVNDSIGWITEHLKVRPARTYTGGERGWVGDSPFIFLDTARIRALGWQPTLTIREGVIKTLDYLIASPWLLDHRFVKVCVAGLWHLGTVTAACLASAGHEVVGFDFDPSVVAGLADGRPPILEPGLEPLLKEGLSAGRLRFTSDPIAATRDARVVWIAYDTPVDEDDRADVEFVVERASRLVPHLGPSTILLISSQVPVGTTARIERVIGANTGSGVHVAYSPENLRLGSAIDAFTKADRIVVGVRHEGDRGTLDELLQPFTNRIEWMTVESAEMTKHAINAFLATSVTFINEIAAVCECTGADASEVARGLKSEPRIGPRAYLSPGGPIAGGTLARDVQFLSQLGAAHSVATPVISSVPESNRLHRDWIQRRLVQVLGSVAGKTIGVWGLTYKPGTSTLRRSSALELCHWLSRAGVAVRAHDPAIADANQLPADIAARLTLTQDALAAADGAAALVVATPWPEYRDVNAAALASRMHHGVVFDPGRFLGDTLGAETGLTYVTFGKGTR